MWAEIDQVMGLVEEHLARRPGMEPRDVYKLLFQGIRGPEHIIASPEAFTERLQGEWEFLEPAGDEPLLESIRPDGRLLRLNLRPFKAARGVIEDLATACLRTSLSSWGTLVELQTAWNGFSAACREYTWPGVKLEEINAFTTWVEAQGYPPVHHSERYRSLYRPAYRLVALDFKLQVQSEGMQP